MVLFRSKFFCFTALLVFHGHIFIILRAIDFLAKKLLAAASGIVELFFSPRMFKARATCSCSLLKCFDHYPVGSFTLIFKVLPRNFIWSWKKKESVEINALKPTTARFLFLIASLGNFQLALVTSYLQDGELFPCKTLL